MNKRCKKIITHQNSLQKLNTRIHGSISKVTTSNNKKIKQKKAGKERNLSNSFLEIRSNIKTFKKVSEFLKSYNNEYLIRKKHYYLKQTVYNQHLNKVTSDIRFITEQSKKLTDLKISLLR